MYRIILLYCVLLSLFFTICCSGQEIVYTNHVGLYKNINNAKRTKTNLEQSGFEVYITDKSPYRVTVGRYDNWNEAIKDRKKLKELKYESYIIEIWKEYVEKVIDTSIKEDEKKVVAEKESRVDKTDNMKMAEKKKPEGEDQIENNVVKDQNSTPVKDINIFPLGQDSILKGMFGSQTLFFFFNKNWEPESSSYLNLIFSYYQETNKQSAVTVYFNENPIQSFKLTKQQINKETRKVDIPRGMIKKGYNSIKILVNKGYDQSANGYYNQAEWFVIKDTTAVHLNYKEGIENLKLSNYPYPFLKEGWFNPIDSVFVIPANYSSEHLSTIACLAAGFGKREPYKNLNLKVITSDQLDDYKEENLILIGNNKEFQVIKDISEKKEDKSVIELFTSPWNKDKKILYFAGPSDKYVELARMLFFDNIVSQMKRKRQVISNFDIKLSNDNFGEKITFKMLGYDTVNLNGLYQLKALYNYQLPAGWQLTEGASLNLKFRYSQAINFKDSSIFVKVNDIPIMSKNISSENANGDSLICKFPGELLDKQSFDIEVKFNLNQQESSKTKWAVVSNESYLHMPHERVEAVNLDKFPYLFFEDGCLKDLVVVLPNQPDIYIINVMTKIFAYMGRLANDIRDVYVIRAKDLMNDLKKKNMILLGTAKDNPIIKQVNRYLPVPFNQDYTNIISSDNFYFLEETGVESGIVEIIDSIWDSQKIILIASGVSNLSLRNTELLLTSIDITPEIAGQVSMMDDFGEMYVLSNTNTGEKSRSSDIKKKVITFIYQNTRIITVSFIMFCLIIIIILLVFMVNKKSRTNKVSS